MPANDLERTRRRKLAASTWDASEARIVRQTSTDIILGEC